MTQTWTIDGPRFLDVGDDGERVKALSVTIVGGTVDVVTHDDSPTARVEVTSIEGAPLQVDWDGSRLKIAHVPTKDGLTGIWKDQGSDVPGLLAGLKAKFAGLDKHSVRLSLSVPQQATVDVKTVSATALVSGVRDKVNVKTVSGSLTIDDIVGAVGINTVSGEVDARQLVGPVKVVSVSGAVTVQASDLRKAAVRTVSGDITLDLTNANATIDSNSVSGDVTVRAPYAGYAVSAKTMSGHVVIGGRSYGLGKTPPSASVAEGDRGLKLNAKAVSGSITLLPAQNAGHTGSEPRPDDQSGHVGEESARDGESA